jgi:hypothetical protein
MFFQTVYRCPAYSNCTPLFTNTSLIEADLRTGDGNQRRVLLRGGAKLLVGQQPMQYDPTVRRYVYLLNGQVRPDTLRFISHTGDTLWNLLKKVPSIIIPPNHYLLLDKNKDYNIGTFGSGNGYRTDLVIANQVFKETNPGSNLIRINRHQLSNLGVGDYVGHFLRTGITALNQPTAAGGEIVHRYVGSVFPVSVYE